MPFRTDHEAFWAGEFGDGYVDRNQGDHLVSSNVALFAKILQAMAPVRSVIEFGASVGLNLRALRTLLPSASMTAIEINAKAAAHLETIEGIEVHRGSILEYTPRQRYDLVVAKGVLIHIDPAHLAKIYDTLFQSAARYICLVEYYSPTPAAVVYRGHADRLFKRDFAGEMLDAFPALRLVDYGFVYRRDPQFPQDDVTWFVLERRDVASKSSAPEPHL
jgi:pseudaminic acid biosynthesis-associated methylase